MTQPVDLVQPNSIKIRLGWEKKPNSTQVRPESLIPLILPSFHIYSNLRIMCTYINKYLRKVIYYYFWTFFFKSHYSCKLFIDIVDYSFLSKNLSDYL